VTIYLVNTHFVEEVAIVAVHRTLPTDHLVYRLLEPHWLKTLSLNAAARSALVPSVIVEIVGLAENQLYAFIKDAYGCFKWTALYIPNELSKRGFPIDQLTGDKFHNYALWKEHEPHVASSPHFCVISSCNRLHQ